MYSAQRWTGGIAFAYILWHTWTMRFTGIDLHIHAGASFGKVQEDCLILSCLLLRSRLGLRVLAFAYGIWLFAAKWGIVSGEQARRRFLAVCLGFFLLDEHCGIPRVCTRSALVFRNSQWTRWAAHRGRRETQSHRIAELQKRRAEMASNPKIIVIGG